MTQSSKAPAETQADRQALASAARKILRGRGLTERQIAERTGTKPRPRGAD